MHCLSADGKINIRWNKVKGFEMRMSEHISKIASFLFWQYVAVIRVVCFFFFFFAKSLHQKGDSPAGLDD